MKKSAYTTFKNLSFAGLFYVLIFSLVWFSLDRQEIAISRINVLKDYGSYPKDFLRKEASYDQKKFIYARKYYRALLKSVPFYDEFGAMDFATASSRINAMIAICEYYLGHPYKALTLFKKARDLQPNEYWLTFNIGIIYFNAGDYASAVTSFKKIVWADADVLEKSMQTDCFQYWPEQISKNYLEASKSLYRKVVAKSFELLIASEERLENRKSEYRNSHVFVYNPSLDFIPIGQEVIVAKQYWAAVSQEKKQ